ncbi:acyl-CoA dehydrogenase family protein, partial [Geobacillus sp. G4]
MNSLDEKVETLEQLIEKELKPYVKKIDAEGFYQEQYLRELGKAGFFSTNHKSQKEYILQEMKVVEETAKWCMTTAFCLWCHLAALTYVRNSN